MMNNVLIFIMVISQVAFKVQTVSWGGFLPVQSRSSIDSILLVIASAPPILHWVLFLYLNFHMLLIQLFQERCLRPPTPSYLLWWTTCFPEALSPLTRSVSLLSRLIPSNPKTVNLHGVSHLSPSTVISMFIVLISGGTDSSKFTGTINMVYDPVYFTQ